MGGSQRLFPDSLAIGSTAIAGCLSFWLNPFLPDSFGLFFYLAVLVSSWFGGLRPGMVAAVLSGFAIDYFWIPPVNCLGWETTTDLYPLGTFLFVALTLGGLASHLQETQRRLDRLSESFDRNSLNLAFQAAQMGMWGWNLVTGEIEVTPEFEQLLGFLPGSLKTIEEAFDRCVYPDDRAGLKQAVEVAISSHTPYHHEFRVIGKDGRVCWLEVRGYVLYNPVGEAVRMTGTVITIDNYKQAQLLLQQQFEQQRLVMEMTQHIRQSLNLQEILQTTVDRVRHFLQTDRVIIFQFFRNWHGIVTVESCGPDWTAILSTEIYDPCFGEQYVEPFQQGLVTAKSDIQTVGIDPCYLTLLSNFQVRANLVVPILLGDELWGLLIAHHCVTPRSWQDSEIALLRQIASQTSIALQQAALLEQAQVELNERKQAEEALQRLNAELEGRVAERTLELTTLTARLLVALQEQAQTQEALRKSEESRRLALDLTHIGCWDLHLPSGHLVWNENHFKLLGLVPGSITPSYELWRSHLHPEDINWVEQSFLESIEKHTDCAVEYRVIHANGSVRWLMARSQGIYDATGQPLRSIGVLLDISDRKLAEVTLQQQTRQKQLLWNITQAIRHSLDIEVTLKTAVTEVRQVLDGDRVTIYRFNSDWSGAFIVESVADGWVKMIDTDRGPAWGDTYLQETQGGQFRERETFVVADIYTAGLQPCDIQQLEQLQAKAYAVAPIFVGESLWGLFSIYQNRGSHFWKSWEIELLQQIADQLAVAIHQAELYRQLQIELQERYQATAILREAERRWRSLLDNVKLLVIELDRGGNVNYVNPFFCHLTGYDRSAVLGKNWFENFLPPSNEEKVKFVFSEVLAANSYPYYQNSILTKLGEERFIAWNNTMLQDSEGTTIGVISIGEDITERQRVEQIKNEFISIVSHELRTPLTAIQMSLGLLKTGIYADRADKAQRMIEIALKDTNRLVNLVNDILDLERLDSGRFVLEKTLCQASDLMQAAVEGIQAIATQEGITLIVEPTDIRVWTAADSIIQTLTNLLSNAIKFSSSPSIVHLRVERQVDCILFQVADRGRGIPTDKLEIIFGRFQQVDASDSRKKGGTGLGLPICRSIIERHGGRIWVESTLGQGSTFFFTLPLPPEEEIRHDSSKNSHSR